MHEGGSGGGEGADAGFGALVRRAHGDDVLAARVGRRADLPRHHFVRLLAKASDAVRKQLQAGRQEPAEDIRSVVQALRDTRGLDLETALRALAAPLPKPRLQLHIADDVLVLIKREWRGMERGRS